MKKIIIPIFLIFILALNVFAGYTTLSVSKVDFQSNDPILNSKSFLITGIAGFNGASYIAASAINDPTDKAQATKNLYIDTTTEKYSCDYSFIAGKSQPYFGGAVLDTSFIYSFHRYNTNYWNWEDCYSKPILGENEIVAGVVKPSVFSQARCIIAKKVYKTGYISQPTENFELTFSLNNGESTLQSGTITSKTISQTYFNSGNSRFATIDWSGGGLKTPYSCPTGSTTYQMAIQNLDSPDFYLIPYEQYMTYKNQVLNFQNLLSSLPITGIDAALDSELNNYLNSVVNSFGKSNMLYGQDGKSYVLTSALPYKTISLNNPFTLPLFTMRVNADWVGVVIQVGKPDIISVSPAALDFKSGLGQTLNVNVKNIGSAKGTFKVYAQCQGKISSTEQTVTLDKLQTGQVQLFFNSNYVQDNTESCIVTAYDLSNSDNKDTYTVSAHSSPVLSCENGITTCIGNVLQQCNNNAWKVLENCAGSCSIIDSKTAKCIVAEKQCLIDSDCPSDYVCNNNNICVEKGTVNAWSLFAAIVLSLISTIVIIVYTIKFIPDNGFIKALYWIGMVVAFILLLVLFGWIIKFILMAIAFISAPFKVWGLK